MNLNPFKKTKAAVATDEELLERKGVTSETLENLSNNRGDDSGVNDKKGE